MRTKDAKHLKRVKRTYGLTPSQYDALLAHQHHRCAICGVHQDQLPERLCVDHDHVTDAVRGFLCRTCNASLGSSERHGTGAFSHYLAWPPAKELAYRQAHPERPHPV